MINSKYVKAIRSWAMPLWTHLHCIRGAQESWRFLERFLPGGGSTKLMSSTPRRWYMETSIYRQINRGENSNRYSSKMNLYICRFCQNYIYIWRFPICVAMGVYPQIIQTCRFHFPIGNGGPNGDPRIVNTPLGKSTTEVFMAPSSNSYRFVYSKLDVIEYITVMARNTSYKY